MSIPKRFISGGPIDLTEGWAIIPFKANNAVHYWKSDEIEGYTEIYKGQRVRFWKSMCGIEARTYAGVQPLDAGNFPKCKRCQNHLD